MKFLSFCLVTGVAATSQKSTSESLTEYDRATVGLDELMGDLSGQMSEMRDFPKSVFFHEAQIQGLGSHLNNLNPFEVQREQQRANKVPEVNNIVSEGALNKKETDPVLPVEEIDAASAPRAAPKLSGDSSVDDGALPMYMRPQHVWLYPVVFLIMLVCVLVSYQSQKIQRKK